MRYLEALFHGHSHQQQRAPRTLGEANLLQGSSSVIHGSSQWYFQSINLRDIDRYCLGFFYVGSCGAWEHHDTLNGSKLCNIRGRKNKSSDKTANLRLKLYLRIYLMSTTVCRREWKQHWSHQCPSAAHYLTSGITQRLRELTVIHISGCSALTRSKSNLADCLISLFFHS